MRHAQRILTQERPSGAQLKHPVPTRKRLQVSIHLRALVALAPGLAIATSPAIAQETAQDAFAPATLEEIVVTARRRAENLQSVPIAISAFDSDEILSRDISQLSKLAEQTPGMNFQTTGALTANRVTIRGMSQLTRGVDETNVASFVDGVYTPGFSGTEFVGYESLERIEVVKGPQSALYGRNSFAGAINYVTKKPAYEPEFGARITLGDNNQQGIYGFASVPLVEDTLAARLDAGLSETGGTFTGYDGESLGSAERKFARLGVRWDVTDNFRANLTLAVNEDDVATPALTQITDDDSRRIGKAPYTLSGVGPFVLGAGNGDSIGLLYQGALSEQSSTVSYNPEAYAGLLDTKRGSLQLEWDFSGATLVSLTGYQKRKLDSMSDFNTCRPEASPAICDSLDPNKYGTYVSGILNPNIPNPVNLLAGGPYIANVLLGTHEDRNEFSQDIRLQSNDDGPFSWSLGAYFSSEEFTDQTSRQSDTDLVSLFGTVYALAGEPQIDATNEISNKFISGYGSFAFDFLSMWNFSFEGRVTKEEKQTNQTENNFPSTAAPTGYQSENFRFFTPRAILSLTPVDPLLVYASASKGVKSGGFNPGAPEDAATFKPEKNWTYELGSKYSFWGDRARINGAVYHIDWTDQQFVSTVDGTNPIVTNVAETKINGLELEGVIALAQWLNWNIGYAYADPKYTKGTVATLAGFTDCDVVGIPCDAPDGTSTGDVSGKQVIGVSKHSVVTGLGLNAATGWADWAVIGRIDYSHQSKQYIDEANAGYIPDYGILNLRLGMQNANWTAEGYCNNAADESTPVYALPPRDLFGVPHYFAVNRNGRMCGVQVAYQY